MPDEVAIGSFWSPEAVKPTVLTPITFLRVQASKLAEQTRGLLIGDVSTVRTGEGAKSEVVHNLDVIAPALGNNRTRFLVVRHKPTMVYPAYMETMNGERYVQTEAEFQLELRQALSSPAVIAVMQSLIARSNEVGEIGDNEESDTSLIVQSNEMGDDLTNGT